MGLHSKYIQMVVLTEFADGLSMRRYQEEPKMTPKLISEQLQGWSCSKLGRLVRKSC